MNPLLWIRGLALVGKLSGLLTFLPGLQILGILAGIGKAFLKVVRWIFEGIAQCFAHPATFTVCAASMLFGAWSYSWYHADLVRDLRANLKQTRAELSAWQQRHNDQKDRADEANRQRKLAEDALVRKENAPPVEHGPAAARSAAPVRVWQGAPAQGVPRRGYSLF